MGHGIFALITPEAKNIRVNFYYKCNDYYKIYEKMMILTDNDHEISSDAASWCELATVGDIYTFREGTIEIIDFD